MSVAGELSVWPVAQRPARLQRQRRYLPESSAHPGKMLPALARTVIERYSGPGDLVIDPMCGIGTTLIEAIHLGRRAVGIEIEPRWAALAAQNVEHARRHGASGHALVQPGDARRLGQGLLDELAGQAALVLTSPPYGPSTHGLVRKRSTGEIEKRDWRYGESRQNLAHLPSSGASRRGRTGFMDALADILHGARRMLAPGGRLVITARAYRHRGALVDLPGQITAIAEQAGLVLCARHAALLCGLREQRLVPRASFFQMRIQRASIYPRGLLLAHEDVLVYAHPLRTLRSGARSGLIEPGDARHARNTPNATDPCHPPGGTPARPRAARR